MIVDLAGSGFSHLMLSIHLESDYDSVRQAWESVGLEKEEQNGGDVDYTDFAGFRKGGQNYSVYTSLSVGPEEGSLITLVYNSIEIPPQKGWRPNLDKIGRLLDHFPVPCLVTLSADDFFSLEHFKPMFDLPLLRFNTPGAFFSEVRGIRLAKLRDGVESDVVTLDMLEEGAFYVHAQTTYRTTLSSDIPSTALVRLVELRNHAVTEVRVDL